jgi:hypothetical protein
LYDPIEYVLALGGKRLRPVLMLLAYNLYREDVESIFSQAHVSTKVRKNVSAILEAGYEKNVYQKGGYDASVNGIFAKLGGFYMLSMDYENRDNGFYAGGKLAASFYNQEYKSVPVRAYGGADQYLQLPTSKQSSYWMEAMLGARVQLFKSKFYIDVNAQPKYMLYTTKPEEVTGQPRFPWL